MKRRYWTAAEETALRRLYPDTPIAELCATFAATPGRIYAKAAKLGLARSPAFLAAQLALAGAKVSTHQASVGTRFQPGHRAWNKGLHFSAGGRSAETRFKPGQVSKRWSPEIYCVGALRINTDGFLEIKVRPGSRSWVGMARYCWESERGPIPPGHVVRALNGDPDDTRIENLRLASRRELMLANTVHNYPKPLVQAIHLRGVLNRRLNRLEKERGTEHR